MLTWFIRLLLTPGVMWKQQKGLCKQCKEKLGNACVLLKPNNSLSCKAKMFGLFCSEDCCTKYSITQRQKLEQEYGQRILMVEK